MKVVVAERVRDALAVLSQDNERVNTSLDCLKNWDMDEFVRTRSARSPAQGHGEVYAFRTSTDLRIFFAIDQDAKTVTVLDVARRDSIMTSRGTVAGGSLRAAAKLGTEIAFPKAKIV